MTTFYLILFIVAAAALLFAMFADLLGDHLPTACPRCGTPDRDLSAGVPVVGAYRRWYQEVPGTRLRCRHCQTRFKNHPNGTLVEDRDG